MREYLATREQLQLLPFYFAVLGRIEFTFIDYSKKIITVRLKIHRVYDIILTIATYNPETECRRLEALF